MARAPEKHALLRRAVVVLLLLFLCAFCVSWTTAGGKGRGNAPALAKRAFRPQEMMPARSPGKERKEEAKLLAGRVLSVQDGDTITVRTGPGRHTERIRLAGIDAPEMSQPYGQEAKRKMNLLAEGRYVILEEHDKDRYGRLVCRVKADGKDLGKQMLEAGLAWHYTRFSQDVEYAEVERQAKGARLGLWREPVREAPWDYRQRNRLANAKAKAGNAKFSP